MMTIVCQRRWSALAGSALMLLAAAPASAQDGDAWNAPSQSYDSRPSDPRSYDNGSYGNRPAAPNDSFSPSGGADAPRSRNDAYSPSGDAYSGGRANDAYSPSGGSGGNGYADQPDPYAAGGDAYSPTRARRDEAYGHAPQPHDHGRASDPGGYGEPYAPPPGEAAAGAGYGGAAPPPPGDDRFYSQNEIVAAGHSFFGAISQGLAQGVEYAFKSQGRPNGYILGEDAGGAFVVGLRYGEGRLFTKDAGEHKVFWQGPSVGYDAGAEGSKTMVLVYNLRDPSEIYERFGGVQGSAYLVGGVSVQFQKYNDVTLAVIRSGVGLRLGANVGYLKYTRAPTWNPL